VRDFLLFGPIQHGNVKYGSLTEFYYERSKSLQAGHSCNTRVGKVRAAIRSPTVLVAGCQLNQELAMVCDAVHWGLTDFFNAHAAQASNRTGEVCTR
jgi:hypothetical protein